MLWKIRPFTSRPFWSGKVEGGRANRPGEPVGRTFAVSRTGSAGTPRPTRFGHALRRGEPLSAKEKTIHDDGLVTLLKQLHDDIDTAVLSAYGWSDLAPATMPFADLIARGGPEAEALEQELLTRLVALNHERAAEEKRGLIRWLRPEYQNPEAAKNEEAHHQATLDGLDVNVAKVVRLSSPATEPWPAKLPEQVALVKKLIPQHGTDPATLSASFGKANKKRQEQIEGILETLRGLGLL